MFGKPLRPSGAPLGVLFLAAACSAPQARDGAPIVSTVDVHNFVTAYSLLQPSDSTCAPLREYFVRASDGLKAYEKKFDVGLPELCHAIRKSPKWYAPLPPKVDPLDSAASQIRALFGRFLELYPDGAPPPVYFVVGDGIAAGTTTNDTHPIVLIGMERNGSVDGIASTVAHEFVHTQQHYPWTGMLTGGPEFIRGSLLRHSIKEGSANLIAELVTGRPYHDAYGEEHEEELWRDFQRDMHGGNYDRWLYNGWNVGKLRGRPPDLGYFIGYRISKAYYDKAADKRQAIRDILSIRDFDRFLAQSGYGVR